MELALAIAYIHPTLTRSVDYEVLDDNQGAGVYIEWYNTEITQPTQAELDTAWGSVQSEGSLKDKMNRLYEIDTALRKMNAPGVTIRTPSLIAINEAKIAELNLEADAIQDDIIANYESTLVDDIYTSLFM